MRIFDAHFHIIDPRFPIQRNQGFLPDSYRIEDYRKEISDLSFVGGAVVSGSFQGFDTSYLIESLRVLGEGFIGVANVSMNCSDEDLEKLSLARIRGVRFNLKRGGSADRNEIVALSNKLYDQFGWHTELYVSSGDLNDMDAILSEIPHFSIDHFGLERKGLEYLYKWVEQGAKVKATGFGRIDFDPIPVMKTIHSISPFALMFGTDLPSTRAGERYSNTHLELIKIEFNQSDLDQILFKNAMDFYRMVN